MTETDDKKPRENFIRDIVREDRAAGRIEGRVHTRFPPEPNGYLHIGHAKSICLNFGLAADFDGLCNLRFDDTNPETESFEYVASIKEDVRWLGFDWDDREYYASDYYEKLYEFAEILIRKGKAYVCDLGAEDVTATRGTLTRPGTDSPFRNRTVEENLDLFRRMRAGEFPDGAKSLRAKIDMAHPNLLLRDPVMYRIRRAHHYRRGDAWCLYPTYDWAHGQSDSIEGITHSICTLEFEVHRPLYDWFLKELGVFKPRQIEFARLNLSHTVLSKRKLLLLVKENRVDGWDDPRGGGRRFHGGHQSRLAPGPHGLQGGTRTRGGLPGRLLPVRAAGLLLRRPAGFQPRRPGLQPHGGFARRMDQGPRGGASRAARLTPRFLSV